MYSFRRWSANVKHSAVLIYHRWGGLGNHRYQVGFSGDTFISWESLDFQPYFKFQPQVMFFMDIGVMILAGIKVQILLIQSCMFGGCSLEL